jgi:hypothetical protein
MATSSIEGTSLAGTLRSWWRAESARAGMWPTLRLFASSLGQFLRDSTPSRRKQRYGDADFDWDYRVDTTGATVGWRDRLLGLFHSPYQPTDPALFHEMLAALGIPFAEFAFIDIGSGKGRVLLMAAAYPFRRILGIELFPALHHIAEENIRKYKNDAQQCFAIESICADARRFAFPDEPLLLYLFNPLPEAGLREMLQNLERSLQEHPRPVCLLYHNPLLEHVLTQSAVLKKIAGTHQYSVFGS